MAPYSWLHLENLYWVYGGGLLIALAVFLARSSAVMNFTFRPRSDAEIEAQTHHFPDGLAEQNHPLPLFLWVVIIGYLAWSVGYTIFTGNHGL